MNIDHNTSRYNHGYIGFDKILIENKRICPGQLKLRQGK